MDNQHSANTKLHLAVENMGCDKCYTQSQCLGKKLEPNQQKLFSGIIRRRRIFSAGKKIFSAEDKFDSLYVIRSGGVKTQKYTYSGTSVISGFYFSGDLVGIESMGDSCYRNDAIALNCTTICELPFNQLEALFDSIPILRHEVMMLLARKIRDSDQAIINAQALYGEARLLLFLRDLYQRYGTQSQDGCAQINLPMSKNDIACYLGLRPESLSRALQKLNQEGLIRNNGKSIDLLNMETHIDMLYGQ